MRPIVRARVKSAAELAELVCCDGILQRLQDLSGQEFAVYADKSCIQDRKCGLCGTEHKDLHSLELVERINNCRLMAVEYFDLDEGVTSQL